MAIHNVRCYLAMGGPKDAKCQKGRQKMPKIKNQPKKYSALFGVILECTMGFHTSNKIPHLGDLVVKRIFSNIYIWPRNKQTKLCH